MSIDQRADTAGVVVAGGHSTRFGDREKALAAFGGRPMLGHVVAALSGLTDTVVVNCRDAQQADFAEALSGVDVDIRWALDERGDEGPLSGLATALAAVDTELAVVLACDMPLAEPAALAALRDALDTGDAVVPRTEHGPQPLHAVYHVGPTHRAARATLADGEQRLRALLDRLSVQSVAVGDAVPARSLTSIDTGERLREIESEERAGE